MLFQSALQRVCVARLSVPALGTRWLGKAEPWQRAGGRRPEPFSSLGLVPVVQEPRSPGRVAGRNAELVELQPSGQEAGVWPAPVRSPLVTVITFLCVFSPCALKTHIKSPVWWGVHSCVLRSHGGAAELSAVSALSPLLVHEVFDG